MELNEVRDFKLGKPRVKLKKLVIFLCIAALFLITLTTIQPKQAFACSCDVPENATAAMEQATAVIQGKVISIREEKVHNEMYNVALIEVDKSWKGNTDSHVKVYTSWSSCQFDFVENSDYLLYPYEHGGMLQVINCGRNAEVSLAGQDLIELGEGVQPTINVDYNKHFVQSPGFYILLAVIFIALLFIMRPRKVK